MVWQSPLALFIQSHATACYTMMHKIYFKTMAIRDQIWCSIMTYHQPIERGTAWIWQGRCCQEYMLWYCARWVVILGTPLIPVSSRRATAEQVTHSQYISSSFWVLDMLVSTQRAWPTFSTDFAQPLLECSRIFVVQLGRCLFIPFPNTPLKVVKMSQNWVIRLKAMLNVQIPPLAVL